MTILGDAMDSAENENAVTDQKLIRVRVLDRKYEAERVVSVLLGPMPGNSLPAFEAGAHIDLHLADGIVRPYSLANDPGEPDRYLLGILREEASRGGSAQIHDSVEVGTELTIGTPRNLFPLAEDAGYSLLLAGGIGITPLLSMAHRLDSMGKRFDLHVCSRAANRVPFTEALQRSRFAQSVHLHLDDGPKEQLVDLDSLLKGRASHSHVYICGPSGFINHARSIAEKNGWPSESIHVEHFDASPELTGGAFRVVLASSGRELMVPANRTLADVLIEHGVPLSKLCDKGICGTCITAVREGIPDHRDLYQSDEQKAANTHITPCCSRSLTARLVLEL
jgi:vanillate O-demethylase ferredoxin subunit